MQGEGEDSRGGGWGTVCMKARAFSEPKVCGSDHRGGLWAQDKLCRGLEGSPALLLPLGFFLTGLSRSAFVWAGAMEAD